MRWLSAMVLLAGGLAAMGCGSGGRVRPCTSAGQCAPPGEALCLQGNCHLFEADEYATLVVNISFPRDSNPLPASGEVWVFYPNRSDGSAVDCQQLQGEVADLAADSGYNPLLAKPRYLVFNCCGTFFPDNLVQFVRPAKRALVVGRAYEQLQSQGRLLAWGCTEVVDLTVASQQELTLAMQAWE